MQAVIGSDAKDEWPSVPRKPNYRDRMEDLTEQEKRDFLGEQLYEQRRLEIETEFYARNARLQVCNHIF